MNILRFISIALILFILTAAAINIPDEKLVPEAKKLLTSTTPYPAELTGENNAYFAVLGFAAAEGTDTAEAGRVALRMYYDEAEESGRLPAPDVLADIIGPSPFFTEPFAIPQCDPLKPDCLVFYSRNLGNPAGLLRENRLILERYVLLQGYDAYSDLLPLDSWNSWSRLSSGIYAAHALTAAKTANLANNHRYREALDLLAEDILLWRKFLAGSGDMDGKTFSLIALNRDFALLGELVDIVPASTVHLKEVDRLLAPLTLGERSLDQVFDGYFQALYWSLAHYRNPVDQSRMGTLPGFFFKSNATLNDAFVIFAGLKRTSRAAPADLEEELARLAEDIRDVKRKGLDMIYNPMGKLFLAHIFDSTVAVSWNKRVQALEGKITALRTMMQKQN